MKILHMSYDSPQGFVDHILIKKSNLCCLLEPYKWSVTGVIISRSPSYADYTIPKLEAIFPGNIKIDKNLDDDMFEFVISEF